MMETLLGLLKGVAPVLATAVAGPAGGAAVEMVELVVLVAEAVRIQLVMLV